MAHNLKRLFALSVTSVAIGAVVLLSAVTMTDRWMQYRGRATGWKHTLFVLTWQALPKIS